MPIGAKIWGACAPLAPT